MGIVQRHSAKAQAHWFENDGPFTIGKHHMTHADHFLTGHRSTNNSKRLLPDHVTRCDVVRRVVALLIAVLPHASILAHWPKPLAWQGVQRRNGIRKSPCAHL